MSLQTFLVDNRLELIKRTRAKVATRPSPQPSEAELEHGVPLFLSQLAEALCDEEEQDKRKLSGPATEPDPPPTNPKIAQSATLHGKDLRKLGFTIEQVVHDYGDVCQAVTELAVEQGAMVTTVEFHTLNRCLDNAIAGAVTSWNAERDRTMAEGEGHLAAFRRELLDLVETATVSFEVLRDGRVGSSGATAAVLGQSLVEMRTLLDKQAGGGDKGRSI